MRSINNRKKLIAPLLILVVSIVGIFASFFLLNSNQDLRQQADSGAYSTGSGDDATVASSVDEPTTGEFGWNYTTGQAATTDDWSNTDVEIAGTYIQCNGGECKRYVVAIQSTHDALEAYSEARKKENGKCSQNLGGFCVAWEEDKSTEVKQTAETEAEEKNKNEESNEGSRCTQSASCTGGTVCAYSPYGAFCIKQEDAGSAEILEESETLGEETPTNSLGYSSSAECAGRCGTTCGGPGGKYCPIPESETKNESSDSLGVGSFLVGIFSEKEEECVGSWCGQELEVTEEDRARVEKKLVLDDSRTDPQAALMNFLETGDINHLKENDAFGKSLAEITSGGTSDDPEVLLKRMLGEEKGAEVYQTYALPQILGNAINNFSQNPDELEKLCTKTLGSSCNLSSSNAAEKLGKVFEQAYGSNPDFNTSEVAVITANQLFVEAKEEKKKSALDNLGAMIAYSSAANSGLFLTESGRENISQSMDAYEQSREDLKIAIETSHIFNSQDTFEYASTASVRENLSDFTYGTALGNAFMYDNVFDREYDLEEDLGLTGVDAASMTWNQVITQGFNVQNTTENIATNYAIAMQQDYSGPANTSVADVSFQAAQNLGGDFAEALGMDYQAATDGHYALQNLNNASATIADWTTTAGTFLITDTTDLTISELADIAVAAGDEAGESLRQEKAEALVERHNENTTSKEQAVDVDKYVTFQTDQEIVRSKKELDWEVAEKVVAPVAAVVVLPVAVAAGAGIGVIAGASSSVFSFYQGSGMKADALELNRVEISENITNRKNIAALNLMESSLLLGEEVSYEDALGTIEDQVDMLEKQGNMMLASSAVASLTSGAGIINGFSQTGQAAMVSGQAVSKVSQLALNSSRLSSAMSAAGRVGGIGLSGVNAISSGQQSYYAAQSLSAVNDALANGEITEQEAAAMRNEYRGQAIMSGLSSFAATSGVIGNAGGMINGFNSGFDTALTKTDYVLDMMNIPVGLAVDAQNVSQSCFNSAYPADEKACGDAWAGLALSFTQDLASKHASTQAYLAHKNSGADYVQKIFLVDKQLVELLDNNNRTLRENLEITDLRAYREDMVVKALVVNSSLEIPEVVRKKTIVAKVDTSKLLVQAEVDNNKLLKVALEVESKDSNLANKLIDQADDRLKNQKEIIKLSEEIAEIDKQVNQESLDTPKAEIDELSIQRKVLLDKLDLAVNDSNFKSSNLDPSNKLLLVAAENNETFKVYEELRAAQDQVSEAAEKQNIPPPKKTTEKIVDFVKDPVNITKAGVGGLVDRVKNFSFSGFVENSKTNLASNLRDRKTKTVKSKLTDTKNSFDQLVKSQDEIRRSNTEVKRLDQELIDLNKIERDSGLDVDQDFRRSEILGEIDSIKKTLKIFSNDVVDLESQLSKSILAEGIGQKLAQAQDDGDLENVLKVVRVEEITKLTDGKNESGLSESQVDLLKEMVVIKEQITKITSAEELIKQRDLYNEKLTELNQDILGKNPKLENYQKLSTSQEFLKNIDLLNSVDSALAKGNLDSVTGILATREVKIDVGDPLLAVRLETIIRDAEFRTGVSEGIEFFNTRSNQMDTFLKIFEGEKVAIELTTAGGKTFVGSVLLKAQVELLGYKTGSYIAKDGQEADIQQSMMKAYGVGVDEVVILDSTRLSEEGYVEILQGAKFVVANPSNIQFIRNSANNFKDPNFKVANAVYTKLTQDTALYIDELQINLDPSRQAINPVGENSKDIPEAQKKAAEWVGDALKDTLLLNKGGWGLGEHGFLTLKTANGAEIAKFSKNAQEVIFDSLAQRSQAELEISREAYDAVKNNASELDKASYSSDFLKQELSKLGIDISADNAEKILDQIDMVNTFAQGLKMKSGTDYQRMVDTVLRDNGGLDRAVTVPASGAVANEGQSYNAKLQAAMEYIGSKANNESKPNFDGLKSSPDLSYKSTIADFLGDLKNSSVGAVTGALADGKGVAETALGLVTYRSTEAVEKILSIAGSSTGERISVDRSYGIHRDDDVIGVVALKKEGRLDKSAGLNSDGNLKIVMGFDGAKNPLDFAIEMVRDESGVFVDSKFAVQKADGSYSLVKIDIDGKVVSSESVTTKDIQDLYKNGETNLVTIIGRGGATGDSIATSKNIPGITVTSDSAPEGLVAQSGARIDRISGEVAEQYALIISRGADKIDGIEADGFLKISQMTTEDFQNFRNNVEKVQLAVEQAKNTVGLDQGVLASSTRVLSDLIRNSKDPKIQEWASARLLEFSSSETTRDLDLNGGDQETLIARQKKIAAQVDAWNKLFTHPDNAEILKKIKRSNSDLYKEMLGNSAVDSQKLAYAESESTTKEAVMTARNLSEFVERHNEYVVADSESSYVASSGQKPVAQQIATVNQKNSVDGGKASGEIDRVAEDVDYLRGFGLGVANPLTFAGKLWTDRGQFVSSVTGVVKKAPSFVNNVRIVQRDERRIYRGFRQDIEEREQELVELDEKIASLSGDEKREATERKAEVLVEIESRKEYLADNVGNMARVSVFIADIPAATVKIAKNQFSSLSNKEKDGKSRLSSLGNISEKVMPGFAKTGVWLVDLSKKVPGFDKLKTQWVVIKDEAAKKIAERKEASDKEGISDPLIRIISITEIASGKVKEWLVTDPVVIEKRNEVIVELKIKDKELLNKVEKLKTVESLNEFVAERRVAYILLGKKLSSLGTNPQESLAGKNGNEERYQNELDRIEEIERLQKYSGLIIAAMNAETGHFAEQADGSVFRLGELEYSTLIAYRKAAEKEISELGVVKLAEKKAEEDGLEKSEEDIVAAEVDYLRGSGISAFSVGRFISSNFQLGKNKLGTLLLDKSIPGSARVIALVANLRSNAPDFGSFRTKWVSVRDGASNKVLEGKESKRVAAIVEWSKTTSKTVKSLFVEDTEIAKRKRDILVELKIKDAGLKDELNKIKTENGLNEFVAERRAAYILLGKKLTSLGTKPQESLAGENGNEERYQSELKRIEEIEQLQRDSLLVFVEMDEETGHFVEQENGIFERLGEYKDLSLGGYIKLADKRINELEVVKIVEEEEARRLVDEEERLENEEENKEIITLLEDFPLNIDELSDEIKQYIDLNNSNQKYVVSKEGDEITGFSVIELPADSTLPVEFLYRYVLEDHRRKGIGSRLRDKTYEISSELGYKSVNSGISGVFYFTEDGGVNENTDGKADGGWPSYLSMTSSSAGINVLHKVISTTVNQTGKVSLSINTVLDTSEDNLFPRSGVELVEMLKEDSVLPNKDNKEILSIAKNNIDRLAIFENGEVTNAEKKSFSVGSLIPLAKNPLILSFENAINSLVIAEDTDLYNQIDNAETVEEINSIVDQRKEEYEKLKLQFNALGTNVKVINNETDYKNELDRLSLVVIEIEDLQNRSGLVFINVDSDNKVPKTEGDLYEITRVDDLKVLSKFRIEANREINEANTLPINPLNNFDPISALENLQRADKNDKKDLLSEYKKNLAFQRNGIAETQEFILTSLLVDQDIDITEFTKKAVLFAKEKGLNDSQIKSVIESLELYSEKRTTAEEILNISDDPKIIFEKIFGVKPIGKVKIKRVNHLIFFDTNFLNTGMAALKKKNKKNRFISISYGSFFGSLVGGFMIPPAVDLPYNNNQVIVVNSLFKLTMGESLIDHESRHSLNGLFKEIDSFGGVTSLKKIDESKATLIDSNSSDLTLDEFSNLIVVLINEQRIQAEVDLSDEVIASIAETASGKLGFFKNFTTRFKLSIYPFYNYIGKEKKHLESEEYYSSFIPVVEGTKLLDKKYLDRYFSLVDGHFKFGTQFSLISNSTKAYNLLIDKGYSQEEAFSIFQPIRIRDWLKNAERMPKKSELVFSKEKDNLAEEEEENTNKTDGKEEYSPGRLVEIWNEVGWPIGSMIFHLRPLHHWSIGIISKITEGQKVLEIGSGYPLYKFYADKVGSDGLFVSMDINQKIQTRSKKIGYWIDSIFRKKPSDLVHTTSDATKLPFDNNLFDTVIASNFTGRPDNVKEVYRALKPGGKVIYTWNEILSIPFMSNALAKNLKELGFENIKVRPAAPGNIGLGLSWNWYVEATKPIASEDKEFDLDGETDTNFEEIALEEKQSQELSEVKIEAIGVGGLGAKENKSLSDQINEAETLEAVNLIVKQRKEVDYKNLQGQFNALGTSVKAINNETDYKNELDRLSQIIIEIEDLQNKSGLVFINVDSDKKVPKTEGDLYKVTRVDEGEVLSIFRTKANREIKKLAEKNNLYYQASLVVEPLSKILPNSLSLSELSSKLREINILRDSLDKNHKWIALREGTSNENPLIVLADLSRQFSTVIELHDSLVQDAEKLSIALKSELEGLSIDELEEKAEERKREVVEEERLRKESKEKKANQRELKDQEFKYQEISSVNDINALLKTEFDDIDSIIENDSLQNNFKNLIQESREEQGKLFIITIGNKFWPIVASSIEEINDSRDKIIEISKFQDAIDEPLDLNGMCFYAHAATSVSGISDGVLQTGGSIHSHEKSLYRTGNHAIGYFDVKDKDRTIYFDLTAKIYTFLHENKKGEYSYPMEGLIVIDKIGKTKLIESLYKANWKRKVFDLETILGMKEQINIFLSEEFSPEKYDVLLGQLEEEKEELYSLGRGEDNDFITTLGMVSGNHALILKDDAGSLYIRDLGSKNGTYVNGEKVDSTQSDVKLKKGDFITLGGELISAGLAVIEEDGQLTIRSVDNITSEMDEQRLEKEKIETEKKKLAGNEFLSRVDDDKNIFKNKSDKNLNLVDPLTGQVVEVKKGATIALTQNYIVEVSTSNDDEQKWFMINEDGSTKNFSIKLSSKRADDVVSRQPEGKRSDGSLWFDKTKLGKTYSVDLVDETGAVASTMHFSNNFEVQKDINLGAGLFKSFFQSRESKFNKYAAYVAWSLFSAEAVLGENNQLQEEMLFVSKKVVSRSYAYDGNFMVSFDEDDSLRDALGVVAHEHTHNISRSPITELTEGLAMFVQQKVGGYSDGEMMAMVRRQAFSENHEEISLLMGENRASATQVYQKIKHSGSEDVYEWAYFYGYLRIKAIMETQGIEAMSQTIEMFEESVLDYSYIGDRSDLKIQTSKGSPIHNYQAINTLAVKTFGVGQDEAISNRLQKLLKDLNVKQFMNSKDDVLYLGRSSENDFIGQNPSVSREHAVVGKEDITGLLIISDVGSSYGTYVNGKRVDKNYRLKTGDKVRLGLENDEASSVLEVVETKETNSVGSVLSSYELEPFSGVSLNEQRAVEKKSLEVEGVYKKVQEGIRVLSEDIIPNSLALSILNERLLEIESLIELTIEFNLESNIDGGNSKNILAILASLSKNIKTAIEVKEVELAHIKLEEIIKDISELDDNKIIILGRSIFEDSFYISSLDFRKILSKDIEFLINKETGSELEKINKFIDKLELSLKNVNDENNPASLRNMDLPIEAIMRSLVKSGKHLNRNIVYEALITELSLKDIEAKVAEDYFEESGVEMIERVKSELGDEYIRLLIDPAIGSRFDQFMDFVKDRDLSSFDSVIDLRREFGKSLGKKKVYRTATLTDSELDSIRQNGFVSNYYRKENPEWVLENEYWFDSMQSSFLKLQGKIMNHADQGDTDNSMLISVSDYPEVAAYGGFYQLKDNWDEIESSGKKMYIFPIETDVFDTITYGKYIRHVNQKEQLTGGLSAGGIDIFRGDYGIESFIEFRISKENILIDQIREVDVNEILEFEPDETITETSSNAFTYRGK